MENFDFFFERSVCPCAQQMESFNVHETSQLAVGFFIKNDVLDNVFLVEWMLEELVLELGEEEEED